MVPQPKIDISSNGHNLSPLLKMIYPHLSHLPLIPTPPVEGLQSCSCSAYLPLALAANMRAVLSVSGAGSSWLISHLSLSLAPLPLTNGNNYIGTESCTEPKIVLNDFETP